MNRFKEKRVLIVEDELLIALLIEDFMMELGCEIVGTAARIEPAIAIAESAAIDFAVLDINLAGKLSFPVADVLRQRAIPFIFASGYGSAGLVEEYAGAAVLQKPFGVRDLERVLTAIL